MALRDGGRESKGGERVLMQGSRSNRSSFMGGEEHTRGGITYVAVKHIATFFSFMHSVIGVDWYVEVGEE